MMLELHPHTLGEIAHAAVDMLAGVPGTNWTRSDALEIEFLDLPIPSSATLRRLRSQGVPDALLADPHRGPKEALVTLLPNGRFEFAHEGDEDAETALVVAVRELDEYVVDLAAFSLDRPSEIARLEGRAAFVGQHLVRNPASGFAAPIRVFRNALDWMRAGATGIVVLSEDTAARYLVDVQAKFAAADEDHGRALTAALAPKPTFEVFVPEVAA